MMENNMKNLLGIICLLAMAMPLLPSGYAKPAWKILAVLGIIFVVSSFFGPARKNKKAKNKGD